jgi:hypothetical protein
MSETYQADPRELTAFARRCLGAEPRAHEELVRAMESGTRLLAGEARQLVRVRTGETQRQIGSTVRRIGQGVEGEVRSAAPWSRWLERGRGPVYPIRAKVLRWVAPSGKVIFAPRAGPAAPRPFMAPALANTRPAIRAEFARVGGRLAITLTRG